MDTNIGYQNRAIEELLYKCSNIYEGNLSDNTCLLHAPTGSGKTMIAIRFIDEFKRKYPKDDLIFLWFTVGAGGLGNQSYIKLKEYFEHDVITIESDSERDMILASNIENMTRGVVVVNWEKVIKKNNKQWDNKGDIKNFRYGINKIKINGTKIIVIIDEAHLNVCGKGASSVLDFIAPSLVLKMTATPLKSDISPFASIVPIAPDVVKNAGMIKSDLVSNDGIKYDNDKHYIEVALRKREEVLNEYNRLFELNVIKEKINPLLLIQIPDLKKGETEKKTDEICNHLQDLGVDVKKEVAIWTTDEKTPNLSNISDFTSKVNILIFKKAIAVGWDCPRAQILLAFRDTKSKQLEQQVLGRILRSPFRKNLNNSITDAAYFYSPMLENESRLNIKTDYGDGYTPETICIKKEFEKYISMVSNLNLKTYFTTVNSNYKTNKKIDTSIREQLIKDLTVFILNKNLENNINNIEAISRMNSTKKILTGVTNTLMLMNNNFIADDIAILEVTQIDDLFEKTLNQCVIFGYDRFNLIDELKKIIYLTFKNVFNIEPLVYEDNIKTYICSDSIRTEFIITVTKILNKEIGSFSKNIVESMPFELSSKRKINTEQFKEIHSFKKYLYDKCFLNNRFDTEVDLQFEIKKLELNDDLIWWYKNPDRKRGELAFKYDINGEEHPGYPDYVLYFKNKIIILEMKDDNDTSDMLTAKIKGIHKYINECNLNGTKIYGGVVTKDNNGILKISTLTSTISRDNKISENWISLSTIFK